MSCLEWWLFEIMGFLAGSMSSLSLSTNNIASTLVQLLFNIPYGFSVAGATLIGNLLGAGDAAGSRRVAYVCLCLATGTSLTYASVVAAARSLIPQVCVCDSVPCCACECECG